MNSVTSSIRIDELDRKILSCLLEDAQLPLEAVASHVSSSRSVVWSRIQRLRKRGIIKRYTIVIDDRAIGIREIFYVSIRTNHHDDAWLSRFAAAITSMPEVVEAHRLAGENDYLLKVQVSESYGLDRFYQALIAQVELANVTSNLSMEVIKPYTGPPLGT